MRAYVDRLIYITQPHNTRTYGHSIKWIGTIVSSGRIEGRTSHKLIWGIHHKMWEWTPVLEAVMVLLAQCCLPWQTNPGSPSQHDQCSGMGGVLVQQHQESPKSGLPPSILEMPVVEPETFCMQNVDPYWATASPQKGKLKKILRDQTESWRILLTKATSRGSKIGSPVFRCRQIKQRNNCHHALSVSFQRHLVGCCRRRNGGWSDPAKQSLLHYSSPLPERKLVNN